MPAVLIIWSSQIPPQQYVRRDVLTPQVRAGDHLKIRVKRDVPTFCDAKVKRTIIDGAGFEWQQGIQTRPKLNEYLVDIIVPRGAKEGPARYHAEIYWSCNPWQRWWPKVTIQQETYFSILPSLDREKLQELPPPEELEQLKENLRQEGLLPPYPVVRNNK